MPTFDLWLEFEFWREAGDTDDPNDDVFNMQVTLDDGRKYALNVWTFGSFPRLVTKAKSEPQDLNGAYMPSPDLFVDRMDRELIESVVADLIESDQLRDDWLVEPEA